MVAQNLHCRHRANDLFARICLFLTKKYSMKTVTLRITSIQVASFFWWNPTAQKLLRRWWSCVLAYAILTIQNNLSSHCIMNCVLFCKIFLIRFLLDFHLNFMCQQIITFVTPNLFSHTFIVEEVRPPKSVMISNWRQFSCSSHLLVRWIRTTLFTRWSNNFISYEC